MITSDNILQIILLIKLGTIVDLDECQITLKDILDTGKIKTISYCTCATKEYIWYTQIIAEEINFLYQGKTYKKGTPLQSWSVCKKNRYNNTYV